MGCFSARRVRAPEGHSLPTDASRSEKALHAPIRASSVDTSSRLRRLRQLLTDEKLDIYIVPSTDAHASEYLAPCDQRRAFISGFTGSAGTAIITASEALLFTDSRYWIQAVQQIDDNWSLQKVGYEGTLDWQAWLEKVALSGSRIGIDPSLIAASTAFRLSDELSKTNKRLVYLSHNLVDKVWGDSRPSRSTDPLVLHPLRFAGVSSTDKIANLRKTISEVGSEGFLTSSLSDIMWLLNVRGSDIPFFPFAFCHLFVPVKSSASAADDSIVLFIDKCKVDEKAKGYFDRLGVICKPYDGVVDFLRSLSSPSDCLKGSRKISADLSLSVALARAPPSVTVDLIRSPVEAAKAIKNPVEIEGFRRAYLRDAASWVEWTAGLEKRVRSGEKVSEWEAAEDLTRRREKNEHYAGLAYENISATNENAALPHYDATKDKNRVIDRTTPYLNDSGAQYKDGTIDTTRTYHFGKPTRAQKLAYTAVLKGHIAVASAVWPASSGLTGVQLDGVARAQLSKLGCTFGHGLGHGVGSFLGVHEGPQGLGSSARFLEVPLRPGHVVTIEPGYYAEGRFGIRIESCFVVTEVQRPNGELLGGKDGGEGTWLGFERFTQIPIAKNLVDLSLLSPEEKRWLKRHNRDCNRAVAGLRRTGQRTLWWPFARS